MRTTPDPELKITALREALREAARALLKPGESFEVHVLIAHDGRPQIGRSGIVKTAVMLDEWIGFLIAHYDGDDPSKVRLCCGRTVAVWHEHGVELVSLDE